MTISAAALEMRLTVKHLMRRHGIAPEPCIVPLTVPVAHPMTLDGLASTPTSISTASGSGATPAAMGKAATTALET